MRTRQLPAELELNIRAAEMAGLDPYRDALGNWRVKNAGHWYAGEPLPEYATDLNAAITLLAHHDWALWTDPCPGEWVVKCSIYDGLAEYSSAKIEGQAPVSEPAMAIVRAFLAWKKATTP